MAIDLTFFAALQALSSLDMGFFIDVAMNNLSWVFIFALIQHALFKGVDLARNFVLFTAYIWAFRAFGSVFGLGGFALEPVVFFILFALVHVFVLDTKLLGKHTNTADGANFYGLLFFLIFFVR